MQTLINVGDKIRNCEDEIVTIDKIDRGVYGVFLTGRFFDGDPFGGYLPWELPPIPSGDSFFGFGFRNEITLPNGIKTGLLTLSESNRRWLLKEYDLEWERTIELMKEEEYDRPDN